MDISGVLKHLDEIAAYSDGWHFGEGLRLGEATVAKTRALLEHYAADPEPGLEGLGIFPEIGGQIMIVLYCWGHSVDVFVQDDQIVSVELDD